MMGSAETRPLLDEFSPLVERKRANSAWGTRVKYALATLALVGVAAFAGVAMFPGAANNTASPPSGTSPTSSPRRLRPCTTGPP